MSISGPVVSPCASRETPARVQNERLGSWDISPCGRVSERWPSGGVLRTPRCSSQTVQRESCRTRLMFATRGSRDGLRVSLFKSSRFAYRDTRPESSESSFVRLVSTFLDFAALAACLSKWQPYALISAPLVHPVFLSPT